MTMYALTISTAELGLGILSNARITVKRKRTVVSDVFPSTNISSQETVTDMSGIATILLAADDGTVFHEVRIYNSRDMVIYSKAFTMPPQDVALELLPLEDIISASAYQAVQAKDAAQTSATNAANSANAAATSAASIRIDSETFASIPPLVNPCLVFVDVDETNENLPTIYFFDGTSLQWLPTVEV